MPAALSTNYLPPADVRRRRLASLQAEVNTAQDPCISLNGGIPMLLHWDRVASDLRIWSWPCDEDANRISPDELEGYRLLHYFLPPCCLCSYLKGDGSYTSSKITLIESVNAKKEDSVRRPFVGEYIAECATQRCGYFVVLERFYSQRILQVKYYTKRPKPYNPNVFDFLKEPSDADSDRESVEGFRRIFIGSHNGSHAYARGSNRLKRAFDECEGEVSNVAHQLDTLQKEGLPESAFWDLFIQCAGCSSVIPRHLYPYSHHCNKRPRRVDEDARLIKNNKDVQAPTIGPLQRRDPSASLVSEDADDESSDSDSVASLERFAEVAEAEDFLDDDDDLPTLAQIFQAGARGGAVPPVVV